MTLAVALLVAAPASAQLRPHELENISGGVAVYHHPVGSTGNVGEVRVYDEQTGSTIAAGGALRRLQFLPIEVNGRTKLDSLRADRTQRIDDVPGASRLRLPGRQGSLYHYVRDVQGGQNFGFLWIDGRGRAVPRADRPGVGPQGLVDPFVDTLAVSPDGKAFLVATTFDAGGDLLEVDLTSGRVSVRTPHLPPLAFSSHGLALAADWGVGITDRGIVRFFRLPGELAWAVVEPNGMLPAWLSGEVVLSNNGQWAATTAGAAPDLAHVLVIGQTGDAMRVNDVPAPIAGAGFLPEATGGPYLAVSDDGDAVAWCVEGALSRELFTARTAIDAAAPVQVTRDANFLDTLDEVGVVGFVTPSTIIAAVGESANGPGTPIERFDLHAMTIPPSGGEPLVTGLTRSSGDATTPVLNPPTLKPEDQIFRLPTGFLIHDSAGDRLVATSLMQPGVTTLLDDVKSLDTAHPIMGDVVVALERGTGLHPKELRFVEGNLATAPSLLYAGDATTTFEATAARRGGLPTLGVVVQSNGVDQFLGRVRATLGTVEEVPLSAPPFGTVVGFSPFGGMTYSSGGSFYVWPEGAAAPHALEVPAGPGHVLPGV